MSERYVKKQELGAGGFGRVFLCEDKAIGREVALKVIREQHAGDPDVRARFFREAIIQGRLEHPAIVPIHELGSSPELGPYFVMKRIRGDTLRDVLDALRNDDPESKAKYTRARLLAAFRQICLAIDYAHAHGVVHRDIKPSNVMLGDFGEVHLIDWGLAKRTDADPSEPEATRPGLAFGTPGYMAPEQRAGVVDPRSDIYALGAILYEILTLQRLAPGPVDEEATTGPMVTSMDTTLGGKSMLAPELEAICSKATHIDPERRHRSVRELIDALDRHLEGDRDLELRRALIAERTANANALVDRALLGGPATEEQARAEAAREISRALALDPENVSARHALMRLLLNPPERPPEAVARKLDDAWRDVLRAGARRGFYTLLAVAACFLPLIFSMGVRDTEALIALIVAYLLALATVGYTGFVRAPPPLTLVSHLGIGLVVVATLTRLFGTLIIVPNLAAGFLIALMFHSRRQEARLMVVLTILALALPVVLEYSGVLPRSYEFTGDAMIIRAQLTHFRELPSMLILGAAAIGAAVVPASNVWRTKRQLDRARQEAELRAWYLDRITD